MATRKSRQNTESPTPSASETVPTTPTTPQTRNLRCLRNKTKAEEAITIKTEKIDEEEEAVKDTKSETDAGDDKTDGKESVETKKEEEEDEKEKESSPPAASTRKRRVAAMTKEEIANLKEVANVNSESLSPTTPDDGKTSPNKSKRLRRSAFDLPKTEEITPSAVSKRRNSTGKIEQPTRKLSSRIKKLKQMRKSGGTLKRTLARKPAALAVTKLLKQVSEKAKGKSEKNDSASDSELLKVSRRRSDSVSKCSDMTDTSSFQETKDSEELLTPVTETADAKLSIKQEAVEKEENKPENEQVEAVRSSAANDSGIGADSDSAQATKTEGEQLNDLDSKRPRRLRRKPMAAVPTKVMNTRSRSETPNKVAVETEEVDEEVETAPKDVKAEKVSSPLHIETAATESTTTETKSSPDTEQTPDKSKANVKAESLSPVLVSEGVSEISVKQFYGRADFLENNLGIEKDPKLGEIVQVQEKIKTVGQESEDDEEAKASQTVEKTEVQANSDEAEQGEPAQVKNDAEAKVEDDVEEVHEIDTSTESNTMEIDENESVQDGAKCDVENDSKNGRDGVAKTIEESVRRNSATILNENSLIVLNGEIEVLKKEKKEVPKKVEEDVGEVVLYTISNGMRVNPEKLEKVLESQKLKELDDRSKTEQMDEVKIIAVKVKANEPNGVIVDDEEEEIEEEEEEEQDIDSAAVVVAADEKPQSDVTEIKETDSKPTGKATKVAANVEVKEIERKKSIEAKSAPISDNESLAESNAARPASIAGSSGGKESRSSSIDDESPEEKYQKESHLKTLGLLTHQAAVEATIEKQKQREKIKASIASSSHGGKGKKGNSEYTGTLKTVIKLHRGNNNDKKKGEKNLPLKMTLHKGRGKNGTSDKSDSNSLGNSEEDTYYTIQQQDVEDPNDLLAEEAAAKEHEKLLVIPEKASSFRYHPEKICEDQCFYCGGKFGLFDTPCHIAQIKSAERQKRILEYEEKLTVDSCLCDACFRHVDRRANCPSYKKRLAPAKANDFDSSTNEESDDKSSQANAAANESILFSSNKELSWCQVVDCKEQASYSVRRKWVLKQRRAIAKHLQINLDNTASLIFIPVCDKHHNDINHMMVCVLCNRRLKRNHSYYINQDTSKVDSLLANEGIPVAIGSSSTVVCKLCRYYVNLLLKPEDDSKTEFIRDYRKRLLEFYKVDAAADDSGPDSGNQSQNDLESSLRSRARVQKRSRKSITESEESHSKSKQARENDTEASQEGTSMASRSERNRQKNKQVSQQQLHAEQLRVEQRVQEQLKLKQQEYLLQQQKAQDELRQQQLRASNEDISNLRTNPNISMRELFPGEEEMGLHVNLPFANSWRTPDGWTKVTSTVQYDEPTRRLWEDLQKPYGNQSSFLRHLLLLEKYFRNGDLLLQPSANLNAVTYAESVQHRLQAYDNIPPRPVQMPQPAAIAQAASVAIDLTGGKVTTPNKAITISKVPAKAAQPAVSVIPAAKLNSSADPSSSLLKTGSATVQRTRTGYTVTTEPINSDKPNAATASMASKTDFIKLSSAVNNIGSTSTPKNKAPGLPPELICITSTPNEKAAALGAPPSYAVQMQLTLQQQIQQQHQNSLLLPQQYKQLIQSNSTATPTTSSTNQVTPPKKQTQSVTPPTNAPNNTTNTTQANAANSASKQQNLIRLPDALTEAERKESKTWRPTLMPISEGRNTQNNEVYLTADGRRLPYLVQVQSGGKPYMISIHDYNRMCILRRERLLRDQEMMKNKSQQPSTSQTINAPVSIAPKPTSTVTSGLLSTVTNSLPNTTISKAINSVSVDTVAKSNGNGANSLANKVQIPNKILEQNSLIPINNKSNENLNTVDSLLKSRNNLKTQSSLLKSNAIIPSIQPKPMQTSNLIPSNASVTATVVAPNAKLPLTLANALSHSNVVSITPTPSIPAIFAMNSAIPVTTTPIQLIPNTTTPITITNVSALASVANAAATNQANVSALEALFKTTNQVTTTPTTMLQWAETLNKSNSGVTIVDQSASSILSKIPKSLTVIPQQKRLSKSGDD